MKEIIAESVKLNKDGFYYFNQDPMIFSLVNAIKDLWKIISSKFLIFNKEIQKLKEENAKLKSDIDELKKAVCEINPQS